MEDNFTRTAFRLNYLNLLVVSLLELLLCAARAWTVPHLDCSFVLHGHSHFAFPPGLFRHCSCRSGSMWIPPAGPERPTGGCSC